MLSEDQASKGVSGLFQQMKCHAEIVGNEARGTMRELVQFLGGDSQQLIIVDRWSQGSDPSFRPLISEKFSTWSLV